MSDQRFKNGDTVVYHYDDCRFLCYDGDDAIIQSLVAKGLIIRADAKVLMPHDGKTLSLTREEVRKAIETSADVNDALVILGFDVTYE